MLDMCDTCDADALNDCVQDCSGTWGGDAELGLYYIDADGDGLGTGTGIELCSSYAAEGLVTNGDDEDDFCFSNIHDCLGVCDGSSIDCLLYTSPSPRD